MLFRKVNWLFCSVCALSLYFWLHHLQNCMLFSLSDMRCGKKVSSTQAAHWDYGGWECWHLFRALRHCLSLMESELDTSRLKPLIIIRNYVRINYRWFRCLASRSVVFHILSKRFIEYMFRVSVTLWNLNAHCPSSVVVSQTNNERVSQPPPEPQHVMSESGYWYFNFL